MREATRALMGSGVPNKVGVIRYEIKSDDRKGVTHTIYCRVRDGRIRCSCESFAFRCERHIPTFASADEHLCKHTRTYRAAIARDVAEALTDSRGAVKQ